MIDYKGMYIELFNAITDAINILQKAQQETEELFITSEESKVILLEKPKDPE